METVLQTPSSCQANRYNVKHSGAAANMWTEAMQLLSLMANTMAELDMITFSIANRACRKDGKWAMCLHIFHATVQNKLQAGTITFNAAISACEKSGKWEKAFQVFNALTWSSTESDTISYMPQLVPLRRGASGRRPCSCLA